MDAPRDSLLGLMASPVWVSDKIGCQSVCLKLDWYDVLLDCTLLTLDLFSDEDECAIGTATCTCLSLTGCATTCTNTDGSFDCGCSAGFIVGLDGITCAGEH